MTAARILSGRALNRALLARQLLLERSDLSIEAAVEQVGGLQTQYAPSGYVGLWTRLAGFRRDALTVALEDRRVVQATLMRTTIHIVSRGEYWLAAAGIRRARRAWALRLEAGDEAVMVERAERMREALAGGPRTVRELGALAARATSGTSGSGSTWSACRRRARGSAGAPTGSPSRRTGWAPATPARRRASPTSCARTCARSARHRGATSPLGRHPGRRRPARRRRAGPGPTTEDEAGRELVDLPDAPLPDPDTPAPVRFLPHWDAALLVHARRTGILPEEHRPRVFSTKNPFSVGTYLVDGRVVGGWSVQDGRIVLDPYEELAPRARTAVEEERAALEAFHA